MRLLTPLQQIFKVSGPQVTPIPQLRKWGVEKGHKALGGIAGWKQPSSGALLLNRTPPSSRLLSQ